MIDNCPDINCRREGIHLGGNQYLCYRHGFVYGLYRSPPYYDRSILDNIRCTTCNSTITMKYTEGVSPQLRTYCLSCEKFLQMKTMMISLDNISISLVIELITRLAYMMVKRKEDSK